MCVYAYVCMHAYVHLFMYSVCVMCILQASACTCRVLLQQLILLDKSHQYAYQMVRTDSKEMKLDAFVRPPSLQQATQSNSAQTVEDNLDSLTEMDTTIAVAGSEGCVITQ